MSLLYKTLFEVRLIHEYYITDVDGRTMFDEPDQLKRLSFLRDAFANERESVNKDIDFQFPEISNEVNNTYNLKLIPTYSGFKVLTRVNQKVQTDNSLLYEPYVSFPDDLSICIKLSRKNSQFDQYTNSKINRPVPSVYFFSSENLTGVKTFPYLTNVIQPIRLDYLYEQGELAFSGTDVVAFYKDRNGADAWLPVKGSFFATENDCLMVPAKFKYSFATGSNVTQADFVLKDKEGNEIKKISISSSSFLTNTQLDFSQEVNELTLRSANSLPDLIYTLEVTGNNSYQYTTPIIFSDELYDRSVWAIIMIQPVATNTQFNLIGNDGFLLKRRNAGGVWTDPPVFEIPIKSRISYWRYVNNKGKKLDLIPDLVGYLFKKTEIEELGLLQTIQPRSVSKCYFLLTNNTGTETKYLPNPINYDGVLDKSGRICFDINIPESDLFPVVP
jgi:hypothetical protein